MRFIPIKSQEQQCLLMLHRIRDRLLAERTASINAIRGHLAEFGIVAAQGARGLGEVVIGDADDQRLPARRSFNTTVAAVANKLARIVYAVLSRGEAYRAPA